MRALLAAFLLLLVTPARADVDAGAVTPRQLLEAFFARTDAEDWAGAALLVERTPRTQSDLERLVRRLRVVVDQYGPLDPETASSLAEGDLDDGLPTDRERVGSGGRDAEGAGALQLVRLATPAGQRWLISRATLARVDTWYRGLPSRWLVERLPPGFSRVGPFGLHLWQWLAVAGGIVVAFFVSLLFGRITAFVLAALARRTKSKWDDIALTQLRGPFVLFWFLTLTRTLLPLTAIPERSFAFTKQLLRGGLAAALFWAAISAVAAVQVVLARESEERPGRRALLGLGGRMLKMVLVLIAVVVVMAELGFSVTSLLAGIGVGGLGLALAAQKTVENVFGAFSLGVDQPFREGDAVKVDDIVGTVESIGLRSTRIRTLDRTVVAIPNGKLADMKTETLTARDRFRLFARLSLQHDTPPATVSRVVTEIEALLRGHDKANIDAQARVVGLSPVNGVELEVSCSFLTTNVDEFGRIRQEMLLQILDIAERAEARFTTPPLSR